MPLAPAVRRLVAENQIDPSRIAPTGRGGRITKGDVLAYLQAPAPAGEKVETVAPSPATAPAGDASPPGGTAFQATGGDRSQDSRATTAGRETRQRMSGLRQRIAQRLVQAQQTAAILTTFNEADMSRVLDLRARYKELFRTRHGVGLGFMSFFVKAVVEALRNYPTVNGRIDGNDIVYHNFHDIGVAVSTDRGLMVPVLRNADAMSFAEIEKAIAAYAEKARKGTITVDDLQGGTFTITNGGIFGSLLSTPILNPPQSGILGMHAIKKRPVVVDDQIVDPPDDVPGVLLRSPHHRWPRSRQLPGPDQRVHRGPGTVDAGALNQPTAAAGGQVHDTRSQRWHRDMIWSSSARGLAAM